MDDIPRGLCQCGCGGKTNLAPYSCKRNKWKKGEPLQYIHGHNNRSEEPIINAGGYVVVYLPNHPRANQKGYVLKHILVVEKAFGKPLPISAVVHHANGSRNSGPLVACQDENYHKLLHSRTRALKESGHADWKKCKFCKKWDNPINMRVNKNGQANHRECENLYVQQRQSKNARLNKI